MPDTPSRDADSRARVLADRLARAARQRDEARDLTFLLGESLLSALDEVAGLAHACPRLAVAAGRYREFKGKQEDPK